MPMTSEVVGRRNSEEKFWRDLPAITDYFGPAIAPLQKYLGVGSRELMFDLGLSLGRKAAQRADGLSAREMLNELVKVWDEYGIGRLTIAETDPLVLVISDCTICGQLPGTGEMYECAFHEGFFQGALSAKLGSTVVLHQDTNYEGTAGTWCRRLVANATV
jgi:predicted hydrocarbon binding protein